MSASTLACVDHSLILVDGPADPSAPYLLSMVFANAAARAAAGSSAGSDAAIEAFYGAWTQNLGALGWIFKQSTRSVVRAAMAMGAPSTSLSAALQARVSAEAPGIPVGTITSTFGTAAKPGAGGLSDLLDFWWGYVTAFAGRLVLVCGSAAAQDETPALQLAFLVVDASQLTQPKHGVFGKPQPLATTSWKALLAQAAPSSIDITSHLSLLTLDTDVYASKRDALVAKLGDKAADHYRFVSLSS